MNSTVNDGRYFSVSLMAGPANASINLNLLGEAFGSTIAKLGVTGTSQPLYLDSQTGSSTDKITCLGLVTTPGTQDHKTFFLNF